jgi:uncharacterized protein
MFIPFFISLISNQQPPSQTVKEQKSAFIREEISFISKGVLLKGTIFQPRHFKSAVVLVHGSGKEKRMSDFAMLLAQRGIATFTYDKRGVGESGGVYVGSEVLTNNLEASNLELLGEDASSAVNALSERLNSRSARVGLLGFSQAGWIIPIAAQLNKRVKFMVLFSGPTVSTLDQMKYQFYTRGNQKFWDSHDEADVRKYLYETPNRFKFANTDPVGTLSLLTIPGLWVFGGKDIQVPAGLSIEKLESLKSNGKLYEYRLFPDLGHNTAFAGTTEPVDVAINWIQDRR